MANNVTNDTQQAVNSTLQNFCSNEVLDSNPCLTYCFGERTNNLDCSSHLGTYCKSLVKKELAETASTNTLKNPSDRFAVSNNETNTGDKTNLDINITNSGVELNVAPNVIDRAAQKVIQAHPQCGCFMPIFAYEAYYARLTMDFPPSPQLTAFIATVYQTPNCTYPRCYTGRYKPRSVVFPTLKDIITLDVLHCEKGSSLDKTKYTPPLVDGVKVADETWKYSCVKDKNSDLKTEPKAPYCYDTFSFSNACKNQSPSETVHCSNGDPPCEKKSTITVGECPNIFSCITNSVVRIQGTGARITVNIQGDITVTNECNMSLNKFSKFVDTTIVSVIPPNQSTYKLCYDDTVGSSSTMTLTVTRSSSVGVPAIPPPLCNFTGYFSVSGANTLLTVVKVLKGQMPSPVDSPPIIPDTTSKYPITGEWVLPNTFLSGFGTNAGTYVVAPGGQTAAFGTAEKPLVLVMQGAVPTTSITVQPPSYYKPGDKETSIPFQLMDTVHLYESNLLQTYENASPTKFTGTLDFASGTISVTNNYGPMCPGTLSELEGILKGTEITELVSGSAKPFTLNATPSVWKFKSVTPYTANIGPISMYLTPTSVNRWVKGYVFQIYSGVAPNPDANGLLPGQMNITCTDTNEDRNQLQWSSGFASPTDLRTLNANGQLATHWVITKDVDADVTPDGNPIDETTWEKIYEPDPEKGIQNQPLINKKIVKESGSTTLIIIVLVIMMVLVIAIMVIYVYRKHKVMKEMVGHTDVVKK